MNMLAQLQANNGQVDPSMFNGQQDAQQPQAPQQPVQVNFSDPQMNAVAPSNYLSSEDESFDWAFINRFFPVATLIGLGLVTGLILGYSWKTASDHHRLIDELNRTFQEFRVEQRNVGQQ